MGRKTKKNSLYDPKVWDKVNPENKELVDEFLDYLQSTDHSEQTIYQYNNDLRIFLCYICEFLNNKHFTEITKREYIRWQNKALNEYEWSPARLSRVRSCISSLENYVEAFCDDLWPDYRPIIRKIPAPVIQAVREKTIVTVEEMEKEIDRLVDEGKLEQAVMFALAAYSGRRKAELPRFKMEDFDDDCVVANALYKTKNKIRTKGRGKNGKMINCFVIKKPFDKYLDLWRKYRSENNIESEWLLFNPYKPSEPLAETTINSWAHTLSRKMGKDIYMHCLRHMFTTHLLQCGIPANIVKDIQKWESLEMVSRYDDSEIDDELDKYFNEDGIITQEKKTVADL